MVGFLPTAPGSAPKTHLKEPEPHHVRRRARTGQLQAALHTIVLYDTDIEAKREGPSAPSSTKRPLCPAAIRAKSQKPAPSDGRVPSHYRGCHAVGPDQRCPIRVSSGSSPAERPLHCCSFCSRPSKYWFLALRPPGCMRLHHDYLTRRTLPCDGPAVFDCSSRASPSAGAFSASSTVAHGGLPPWALLLCRLPAPIQARVRPSRGSYPTPLAATGVVLSRDSMTVGPPRALRQ